MDKINHWALHQSGVVYDSEEVSVLNLVGKVTNKVNDVIEELNKKVDVNGDFQGSWQGISSPSKTDEGMGIIVEELQDKALKVGEPTGINVAPLFSLNESFGATGETWGSSQGMCYAENTLVIACRPKTNGVYDETDTRTKYRVISAETGELITEKILNTHYSNSLYYKADTKQILTHDHEHIYYIDYATLSIVKTIVLKTDIIMGGVFEVDGELCVASNSKVYKVFEDGTVIEKLSFDKAFTNNPQSISYHNGYYFVTNFYPNNISVYKKNGKLFNQFSIPYAIQGMSLVEIEDMAFNGDEVYINFNSNYYNDDNINIVKTSLQGGCYFENKVTNYISGTSNTLYVNQSYKGNKVGGTQAYPFKSMNEAITVGKLIYGNGFTLVVDNGTFRNLRMFNLNVTISCIKDNNVVFESPVIEGGNVSIINGKLLSTSTSFNISLCRLVLISTTLETTTGFNINLDSCDITLRNVTDKLASGSYIMTNGTAKVTIPEFNTLSSKIYKANKECTITNFGLISVQGVNSGTIATLPINVTDIVIEMTVANNYKIQAEIKNPVNALTYSFTYKVDTGGGYDTYVVNFTYQNNILSFQKNMRFIELLTGTSTRVDVADATDKTMYPKVTSIYFK